MNAIAESLQQGSDAEKQGAPRSSARRAFSQLHCFPSHPLRSHADEARGDAAQGHAPHVQRAGGALLLRVRSLLPQQGADRHGGEVREHVRRKVHEAFGAPVPGLQCLLPRRTVMPARCAAQGRVGQRFGEFTMAEQQAQAAAAARAGQ